MNVFNRVMMVLLALAVLVAAFILTVWPATWLWLGQQGYGYAQSSRLGYTLGGILAMLLCGLILLLEVRRPRRAKYVVVDRVAGGEARISVESVSRRLTYEVDLLQDVSEAKAEIVAKGRGLKVTLDVLMSPDVDIPMKTDEVIETARRIVEEQMGLRLAGKPKEAITVNIHHPKRIAPAQAPLPTAVPSVLPQRAETVPWTETPSAPPPLEEAPPAAPPEETPGGWSETL